MIGGEEETERWRGILQATLALAAVLELPVTAEGVETEEQATFLRLCGCDQLQGFFFFRPVGQAALADLLSKPAVPRLTSMSA